LLIGMSEKKLMWKKTIFHFFFVAVVFISFV
jgi:hypothetical protein